MMNRYLIESTISLLFFAGVMCAVTLATPDVAHPTAYDRTAFRHWSDLDRDGLNTREEIVDTWYLSNGWVCPYTGEIFHDPGRIDLDHIVPLSWAWRHGADQWTDADREAFANDPDNLALVSADVNRANGDKGPDEWLPPNIRFIPQYIDLFLSVCDKYGLAADRAAMEAIAERYRQNKNGIRP